MTIVEKDTNLRESRVLQSIRIPDANAEEDLCVLYQIFHPPEDACESCQYPVLVAVDIDIFGGIRMDGLPILDTAKLGSASNDGLISTYNLVQTPHHEAITSQRSSFGLGILLK